MKKELVKNNKDNNSKLGYIFIGGLIAITGISGCVLRSTIVSADDDSVIDTVNITVPVSCTMSGNIDTAHNATLNNGTYSGASGSEYENGIGKTTLTTFCNDQNGFSIYAIGYTGDEAGNTDLVGTSVSGNATIPTGINTSGSTSNWAMKVNKVTDSSTSYNPANMTITNSFDNYKAVPDEYTKVAEYHAGTGSSATDTILGAKVETTYAAYISSTQIADTYSGQVKYVMVHPHDDLPVTEDQIKVVYDGNGTFFDQEQTKSKNTVIYEEVQVGTGEYIATTPTIIKTSNLANDGTKNSAYDETERIVRNLTFDGASKVRVNLTYGVTGEYYTNIASGEWDFENTWPLGNVEYYYAGGWNSGYCDSEENCTGEDTEDGFNSGTKTFELEDDTLSISIYCDGDYEYCEPAEDYDYGFYYEIYPIYDTEQSGTIEIMESSFVSAAGTYASAPDGRIWMMEVGGTTKVFTSEAQIIQYLNDNSAALKGETVTVRAEEVYITVEFSTCPTWTSECFGTFSNGGNENIVVYGYDNVGELSVTSGTYEQLWDSSNSCYRTDLWGLNFNGSNYDFCAESDIKAFLQSNIDVLYNTTIRIYIRPYLT